MNSIKLFTLFFGLFIIGSLQAQSDSTSKEVGMNAFFVNNFIPLEDNIGRPSNYILHYRKTKANQKYTRMALGGDLSGVFNSNSNDFDGNNQLIQLDYLIGWGKKKEVFKNAHVFFGWDAAPRIRYSREHSKAESNNQTESTTRTLSPGIQSGPSLGFQYSLGERFGIYTESNYYLNISYRHNKNTIKNDTQEFTSNECSWIFSERFMFPTTLVIWWRF